MLFRTLALPVIGRALWDLFWEPFLARTPERTADATAGTVGDAITKAQLGKIFSGPGGVRGCHSHKDSTNG